MGRWLVSWLLSNVTDRHRNVRLNNRSSSTLNNNVGSLQGSDSPPFMFRANEPNSVLPQQVADICNCLGTHNDLVSQSLTLRN